MQLQLTSSNNTSWMTLPSLDFPHGIYTFTYTFTPSPSSSPIVLDHCTLAAAPCPPGSQPTSAWDGAAMFLRTCESGVYVDHAAGLLIMMYQWDYTLLPSVVSNTTGMEVVMPAPGTVSKFSPGR